MIRIIKRLLRAIIPYGKLMYSQEGEDIVLNRALKGKKSGFYIDVGAHHPKRFSNTYLFYKKGWRGINIDAMPGSMEAFKKERSRDVNLEVAVSPTQGEVDFYVFSEKAFNTCDETIARERMDLGYALESKVTVKCWPLREILDLNLTEGAHIDFMTVDVEGLDMAVLQSNDWERYRPSYVLVECLNTSIKDYSSDPVCKFMQSNHYEPFSKAVNTWIFMDTKSQ